MARIFTKLFTILLLIVFVIPPSFAQCASENCAFKQIQKTTTLTEETIAPKAPVLKAHTKRKRILSLDGGGIKSIITLKMLEYIEQQTGKKTGDIFDYIAGTSSGGLLALYLSMPSEENPSEPRYSASDVIDLLQYDSKKIFERKLASRFLGQKVLQVFRPAYHNKNIEAAMARRFHNYKIKDATTNILVLTFDTQENQPVAFTNYTKYYKEAYMREVGIGTSVAPFYLSPLVYHDLKLKKDRTLIDGGLVAKNASVFAYCEAKNLFPNSDFFVLSLGAGFKEKKQYDYQKLKGWGFLRLSLPIYTFMLDGTSNTNDLYMQKFAQASGSDKYYRFQPVFSNDKKTGFDNKPDNTSDKNFKLLMKMGDMYVLDHKQELDIMIEDMIKEDKTKTL